MIKSNPAKINSIICTAGTNKVHNIRLNSIFNMFSLPHDIIDYWKIHNNQIQLCCIAIKATCQAASFTLTFLGCNWNLWKIPKCLARKIPITVLQRRNRVWCRWKLQWEQEGWKWYLVQENLYLAKSWHTTMLGQQSELSLMSQKML